ncbi:hypothetical protein BDP27DRAFT_1383562 [Rhodocollybia butyracea]|uniref:Glycoside hydrolase 131 catalytic N-terminal domain-containing protein n=1 Tax=Rhodocollybia butyracea TaxID=206335 RepID=A0A9P5U856_9AGAR|nr:hypothetical protein BDP27DRAFT_1383562 [Rhodocollybia butyracea]
MLLFVLLAFKLVSITSSPLHWDGRALQTFNSTDFDSSAGHYLIVYTTLLGNTLPPTPLWSTVISEQVISVTIDNSSVFVPGGSTPQNGFQRTDLIAQGNGSNSALNAIMEVGVSKLNRGMAPMFLNFSWVWTPFSVPTVSTLPADATFLKVHNHALNLLFEVPFTAGNWHNFAIEINWSNLTLQVFYSAEDKELRAVTSVVLNPTASIGSAGQGNFHIVLLKLPLVNPNDSPVDENNVVGFGIQEVICLLELVHALERTNKL